MANSEPPESSRYGNHGNQTTTCPCGHDRLAHEALGDARCTVPRCRCTEYGASCSSEFWPYGQTAEGWIVAKCELPAGHDGDHVAWYVAWTDDAEDGEVRNAQARH